MTSESQLCALTLPAIPAAAKVVRVHLRYWLKRQWWPAEATSDIEYAVSEAVSNAVEHAYSRGLEGPTVAVDAEVEALAGGLRQVRVRVSDHGRWRPVGADLEGCHLGITLMNGLMNQVVIAEGGGLRAGTEVMLISSPVR